MLVLKDIHLYIALIANDWYYVALNIKKNVKLWH